MSKKEEVINKLKAKAEPEYRKKMAYFNISTDKALGVRTPDVRKIAKQYKNDHDLAISLWESGVHETRTLATLIADPQKMSVKKMESWLSDAYSWDLCDSMCFNLIHRHERAWALPEKWMQLEDEYTKRAAFALIAKLALGNKNVKDQIYVDYLELIPNYAADDRDMIKKGVSWAVRQIGKRNLALNPYAISTAEILADSDNKGARWAGKDALRELRSDAVQKRLRLKK
jgi:3-methyladenine DNA glycosylase AlkD